MGVHPWMMVVLFEVFFLLIDASRNASFNENYHITWGNDHVRFLNQGQEVQLLLDKSSGAGFESNAYYGSGYFQMKIKLPPRDSGGIVTAFYLFINTTIHEELDFEFLGNRPGKPISLQTNVFANGVGGREQTFVLWFDPSADFHYYKFLWNHHQIVFFVDETPIRVYKNNIIKGIAYPSKTMQVIASLWDGSNWATDGGRTKANYSNEPFLAQFQDFNIDGCPSPPNNPNKDCFSQRYWWNTENYWQLNQQEVKAYEDVRKNNMFYDYCTDKRRYPTTPPECIR